MSTEQSSSEERTLRESSALKTYDEAAEWLGVTTRWLQRQVQQGKVPHAKLGRYVRFSGAHLERILNDHEVAPPEKSQPVTGNWGWGPMQASVPDSPQMKAGRTRRRQRAEREAKEAAAEFNALRRRGGGGA